MSAEIFALIVICLMFGITFVLILLPVFLYAKGRKYLQGPHGPMGMQGYDGVHGQPGIPGRSADPEETRRIVQQVLDERERRPTPGRTRDVPMGDYPGPIHLT